MESSAESRKSAISQNKVVIAVAALIVVIIAATAAIVLSNRSSDNGQQVIGYASTAKVMLDEDSLQAAMDEAMKNARDGNVALRYKNNAYSADGVNFECFIVNSASNSYDMFLTIFADPELQDQLFLSELVPPGSGFDSITLEHTLDPGDHRVYVAVTQVKTDEETGEQVLHKQVMHTMDFHVTE